MVAIVQLLAYENLLDRSGGRLGDPDEVGGSPPPLGVHRRTSRAPLLRNRKKPAATRSTSPSPARVDDPDWTSLNFPAIQERLERLCSRVGRIAGDLGGGR